MIGTILGDPAPASEVVLSTVDLVDPNLTSLGTMVPAEQRYSYVFDGNAQVLDHVLVTSNTLPLVAGLEWARTNADFPETFRQDGTRPERLSDHDPAVAYFRLPPPPCSVDVSTLVSVTRGGFVFDRSTRRFVQQLTVQNVGDRAGCRSGGGRPRRAQCRGDAGEFVRSDGLCLTCRQSYRRPERRQRRRAQSW